MPANSFASKMAQKYSLKTSMTLMIQPQNQKAYRLAGPALTHESLKTYVNRGGLHAAGAGCFRPSRNKMGTRYIMGYIANGGIMIGLRLCSLWLA